MERRLAAPLLAALLMSSAALVRAQTPETLKSVSDELGLKAKAYATGTVTMDPGLTGKLLSFEKAVKDASASLPAGDTRREISASLLVRSQAVRGWAANAPKPTEMKTPMTTTGLEKEWKAIGAELASMIEAAKALQDAGHSATKLAEVARRSKEAETVALAQAKSAAAGELARRILSGLAGPTDDASVPAGAPRVVAAQSELNVLRKASGQRAIAVDDDYGRVTAAAVLRFQRAHAKEYGLKPTGKLDAQTENALRAEASDARKRSLQFTLPGDENLGVETLQRRLNAAGGYRFLEPDGIYGPRTTDGVRAFQRVHKLKQTGEMDADTWDALIAAEPTPARAGRPVRVADTLTPLGQTWPSKRVPAELSSAVRTAADKHGLDENFFEALVWAEGGRLGDRTSNIARGPAQITRSAAVAECRDLGWNAVRGQDAANLECGARILDRRSREWLGAHPDPLVAASLYNTKEKHWKGIAAKNKVPPFKETVAYVTRISRIYCQITGRRLLDPAKHLDNRLLGVSKRADREMDEELALEHQTPRPGCSPY